MRHPCRCPARRHGCTLTLPGTGASSARIYWDHDDYGPHPTDFDIPVGITVFPQEIVQTPRAWAERAYRRLIFFREADQGGHFAAFEQPDIFAQQVRAFARHIPPSPAVDACS
jgi:pimeloyl-ACP methyl ester carboxylesterase